MKFLITAAIFQFVAVCLPPHGPFIDATMGLLLGVYLTAIAVRLLTD